MTEYCSVSVSWEPDLNPNRVVEYLFHDPNAEIASPSPSAFIATSPSPCPGTNIDLIIRDQFQFGSPISFELHTKQRLHVVKRHDDTSPESHYCWITIECKREYGFAIGGLGVASEARNIEIYDAKDCKYLMMVRGARDIDDSEADNSALHFMCHCAFEQPMKGIKIKFLSLGQRESFEIARIRLVLEKFDTQSEPEPGTTINLEKLKNDIEDMGDTVSDRAKSFLTTLENFQKNKQGTKSSTQSLLLDQCQPMSSAAQAMTGMSALLTMFSSLPGSSISNGAVGKSPMESSMVNNMISQMMASMALQQQQQQHIASAQGDGGDGGSNIFQPLNFQTVQGADSSRQLPQQLMPDHDGGTERKPFEGKDGAVAKCVPNTSEIAAELESKVAAKVEAIVESRLSEVEQHITQQVDKRMEEIQKHMDSKLDTILALMQQKHT